ncbi:YlxR family protein [Trueperella sp.]|uniref:YlxR family protein n=1 Tax=Trueperella sp. TaxID=2699835 RepID=UPI003735DDBD
MPTSSPRAINQRTCIGCRTVAHATELLRFVAIDSTVCVDADSKRGGRGAWVHPTPECLRLALTKRAFNRAFRGPMNTDAVQAWLRTTMEQRAPRDESG